MRPGSRGCGRVRARGRSGVESVVTRRLQRGLLEREAPSRARAVRASRSAVSTVAPPQMRKRGGASRWTGDVVGDALLVRARAAMLLGRTPAWPSARSRPVTAGSTILRHTEVFERVAGSSARKSIHGVFADPVAEDLEVGVGAGHAAPSSPPTAFAQVERVEVVLDAQHRRRVDRLALEDAVDQLAALGHAEDLRQRPGRRVALQPLRRRAGDRMIMPCAASPPSAFCQEKVTTSSLAKSRFWAKAAEVASQMVRPSRSAAIQSRVRARARPRWCRSR